MQFVQHFSEESTASPFSFARHIKDSERWRVCQENFSVKRNLVIDPYQVLVLSLYVRRRVISGTLTLGSLRVFAVILESTAGITRGCL